MHANSVSVTGRSFRGWRGLSLLFFSYVELTFRNCFSCRNDNSKFVKVLHTINLPCILTALIKKVHYSLIHLQFLRASERQIRVSCEQNAFPVCCLTNKEISQLIKQAFPKYTKKVKKFGLEVLIAKALSFWLEFIDKTGEKVFCLQMQIKLKSCVTLFSWLVHK